MAGLLEGQEAPVEAAGTPEEAPIAAPGEEISPEATAVLDEALNIAYSEEAFPKMVAMFEKGGLEGFPKAMGAAVTGTMQGLAGKQTEAISDDVLAEVGVKVFEAIAEDMITGGVVQGVTREIITAALQESIAMWAQLNPDKFDVQAFEQAANATLEAEGTPPAAAPAATTEPQPAAPSKASGLLSGAV